MAKLSPHFDEDEFKCHHCGKLGEGIDPLLVESLEQLREALGKPIRIVSGYRCKIHNQKVGGVPKSQHVLGKAADIEVKCLPGDIITEAEKIPAFANGGIGIYKEFIHLDVRGKKARWMDSFVYKKC